MLIEGLSIKTTALCQQMCKHCTVIPWMNANPDYHTSVEDIEALIKMSKDNDIKWGYILLSGGEPLLWKSLKYGTKILSEAKITDNITLITNAKDYEAWGAYEIKRLLKNVDHFRISQYHNNDKAINWFKATFGGKIEVEDRTEHLIAPDLPVPLTLPADCRCRAYAMVHGNIDSCGPARTISHKIGVTDVPRYTTRISNFVPYFIESGLHRFDVPECQYCIANAKVQPHLRMVKHGN